MARLFNGTSDDLQSASTLTLGSPTLLSLSFWLWVDAFGNNDHVGLDYGDGTGSQTGALTISPNDSATGAFSMFYFNGGGFDKDHFTRPSAAAWHHYVFNFDASNGTDVNQSVYVDAVSQTLTHDTHSNTTGSFSNLTLNCMAR